MTIGELKKRLAKYDDNLEVVFTFYDADRDKVLTANTEHTLLIMDHLLNKVEIFNNNRE